MLIRISAAGLRAVENLCHFFIFKGDNLPPRTDKHMFSTDDS